MNAGQRKAFSKSRRRTKDEVPAQQQDIRVEKPLTSPATHGLSVRAAARQPEVEEKIAEEEDGRAESPEEPANYEDEEDNHNGDEDEEEDGEEDQPLSFSIELYALKNLTPTVLVPSGQSLYVRTWVENAAGRVLFYDTAASRVDASTGTCRLRLPAEELQENDNDEDPFLVVVDDPADCAALAGKLVRLSVHVKKKGLEDLDNDVSKDECLGVAQMEVPDGDDAAQMAAMGCGKMQMLTLTAPGGRNEKQQSPGEVELRFFWSGTSGVSAGTESVVVVETTAAEHEHLHERHHHHHRHHEHTHALDEDGNEVEVDVVEETEEQDEVDEDATKTSTAVVVVGEDEDDGGETEKKKKKKEKRASVEDYLSGEVGDASREKQPKHRHHRPADERNKKSSKGEKKSPSRRTGGPRTANNPLANSEDMIPAGGDIVVVNACRAPSSSSDQYRSGRRRGGSSFRRRTSSRGRSYTSSSSDDTSPSSTSSSSSSSSSSSPAHRKHKRRSTTSSSSKKRKKKKKKKGHNYDRRRDSGPQSPQSININLIGQQIIRGSGPSQRRLSQSSEQRSADEEEDPGRLSTRDGSSSSASRS
mmetsp:Transcript_9061/g.22174  ORF Transcript_9061/g.22174 Transcript_9061/m.22174 type:complete len:588 (+) Transcript_9061:119-1882(+)